MTSSTTLTVDPNGNGNCFTLWRTEHERDNTPNPTRSSSFGLSCIVPSSCSKPPIIDHLILLSTKNNPWCNCHIFCLHLDVEGDVFLILAIPFDGLPTMRSKEITAGMQHLKRCWEKRTGWCERGVYIMKCIWTCRYCRFCWSHFRPLQMQTATDKTHVIHVHRLCIQFDDLAFMHFV